MKVFSLSYVINKTQAENITVDNLPESESVA